jgi:hypothetical protein
MQVCGSFGLPVGLVLVLTCGAELFTGNVAMLAAAVVEVRSLLHLSAHAGTPAKANGSCVLCLLLPR